MAVAGTAALGAQAKAIITPTRVVEFGVQKLSRLGVYCTVLKFSVLKGIERVEGSLSLGLRV